jgi:hypothetical protein
MPDILDRQFRGMQPDPQSLYSAFLSKLDAYKP